MPTIGQRTVAVAALAAAGLAFATHCGHQQSQCEPFRRPTSIPTLPSNAATARAVEQSGFRYEPCPGQPRYRLVRPGPRALTADELGEVRRKLLTPTPGLRGVGIGSCACDVPKTPAEKSASCVSISVGAGDLDPPALAQLISGRVEALSLGAVAVAVRVDVHAKPEPRCLPEDPGCGPIPVAQQCIADIQYVPGRPRVPVFEKLNGGDCAHDGECDSALCGDSCYSTRGLDSDFVIGSCFTFSGMKPNALCGCVAGQCTFFTQPP